MNALRALYHRWKQGWKLFWAINWYKTYRFNLKMFPFAVALKLPVIFYGSVKFGNLNGTVILKGPVKKGMIGFGQPYELVTRSKGTAELFVQGTIIFNGYAQFGKDYFVHVAEGAFLEMGNMASMASNGKIICKEKIVFGDYARMGSEAQLMDTNFHQMYNTETGEQYPMTGRIHLGNYNFVSNRVTVMQGTVTPNFCTIASNTLCTKNYTDLGENILIGGIPAKLLKTNISRDWKAEEALMERYLVLYK